jgi:hypothetical protein
MTQKPLRTVWVKTSTDPLEWSLQCKDCHRRLAQVQVSEGPKHVPFYAFFWSTTTMRPWKDWRADFAPTLEGAKRAARKAVTRLLTQYRDRQARYPHAL